MKNVIGLNKFDIYDYALEDVSVSNSAAQNVKFRFDKKGNVIDASGKIVRRRDGGGMKPNKVKEN